MSAGGLDQLVDRLTHAGIRFSLYFNSSTWQATIFVTDGVRGSVDGNATTPKEAMLKAIALAHDRHQLEFQHLAEKHAEAKKAHEDALAQLETLSTLVRA